MLPRRKLKRYFTSSHVIAIATEARGTKVFWTVSPASTVPDAELVFTKISTRSSKPPKERPRHKFGQGSSRANGNRSTRPSIRSRRRQSDSQAVAMTDVAERSSEGSCHVALQFVN